MIQINLTLIVQIVNFWITYIVLTRFIFKPVITRILFKKDEERKMRREVVLKQKDIDNFSEEKRAQLAQFQKDAMVDYPFYVTRPVSKPLDPAELNTDELSSEEHEAVTKQLKERLSHVD